MAEITKEMTMRLFENSGKAISDLEIDTDRCVSKLVELDNEVDCELVKIKKSIYKTRMMLNFINLDLCAAYRQYLSTNTSTNYEKRQSMTKINIVMSEGFKKTYGFGESQHNKSFLRTNIKSVISYIGEFDDEYNYIEAELEKIESDNTINQDMRDLAVHYDKDPIEVYNMLKGLSAEEVTNRCLKFMYVLEKILFLTRKISVKVDLMK